MGLKIVDRTVLPFTGELPVRPVISRGSAVFTPGKWYLGPWLADPTVPAINPSTVTIIAYQPKWAAACVFARTDAESYANSKLNLHSPGTNDAYEGIAPTWASASGWGFNTSTQYLLTGFQPGNSQDRTYLVAFSGIVDGTAITYIFGATDRKSVV